MNHILKKFNINTTDISIIEPKIIGVRKKIDIFTTSSHSIAYIHTTQKARILQKDIDIFEKIIEKLQGHFNIKVKQKHICIDSPLCSKAKAKFEENRWKVYIL